LTENPAGEENSTIGTGTKYLRTYVDYRIVSGVFFSPGGEGSIFWKTPDIGLASCSIISLRVQGSRAKASLDRVKRMSKQAVFKIAKKWGYVHISSGYCHPAEKTMIFRKIKESRKPNLMLLVVLPSSGKSTLCHHTVHHNNSHPSTK
jgi:hypothetical protein